MRILDLFADRQLVWLQEGQKANKNWLISSANLSHAVEARKIFVFSQRAEEAKQRVLRFNSDVKAFNDCRDKVYSSPAHQQALEYMSKESVTMADGSVQLRSTMEQVRSTFALVLLSFCSHFARVSLIFSHVWVVFCSFLGRFDRGF